MSNTILLKSNANAGVLPATSSLKQRELALNTADSLLYALNASGTVTCLNPIPFPVYNGSTLYRSNLVVKYANSGLTDSSGRVAFNVTKDGTATGTAIFSKVFAITATSVATGTSNVGQYQFATVESVTTKIVTIRSLMPIASFLSLGSTANFSGSGVTIYLEVTGLP